MKMAVVLGIVLSVLSLTLDSSYAQAPMATGLGGRICAIQTINSHFLTAVGGGGRITDVIHTDATKNGGWERFTLVSADNGFFGLKTVKGYYLTAVGGGGKTSDVIHSDAVKLQGWEKFKPQELGNGYYAISTINSHYLTATGGGGKITDAIHSDATGIGAWEKFMFVCAGGKGGENEG